MGLEYEFDLAVLRQSVWKKCLPKFRITNDKSPYHS
jgi:hypothetical protein